MMTEGIVYTQLVQVCTTLDQAVFALINGSVVFALPGREDDLLLCRHRGEAGPEPPGERALPQRARDSFVESLRTNTSLVRRRLRAPELKVRQHVVGRQSLTPAMVVYLDGIADPDTVKR
mgnify:CR=1 FL=1